MKTSLLIIILLCLFSGSINVNAQRSEGGVPASFELEKTGVFQEVMVSAPSPEDLWGDEDHIEKNWHHLPFARVIPVGVSLHNSGTWTFSPDGMKIWRIKIRSENALSIGLYFHDVYLPEGAKLFLYDEKMKQLLGAFTSHNNRNSGLLATQLISGDAVIVELNMPSGPKEEPRFTIAEMDYAFRPVDGVINGSKIYSGECEVDVNCIPEGGLWQEIKKGIVRIKVKVGFGAYWCTGVLMNNTSHDYTPYILTADHCAFKVQYASAIDIAQWVFRFNYETTACNSTQVSPDDFSLSGAVKMAQGGDRGTTGSDFYLVRLMDDIPDDRLTDVYFTGWSRDELTSNSGVCIHHPGGDVKKISTYITDLGSSSWQNNGIPSHWRVFWSETLNGWGVTEGGSSGSPIFDPQGRIRGTLTGGLASCDNPDQPDYYGKFSWHWESNGTSDTAKLAPWLDPENTGQLVLDGQFFNNASEIPVSEEGLSIKNEIVNDRLSFKCTGNALESVRLKLVNSAGQQIASDEVGVTPGVFTEYDISRLSPGFYLCSVTFNNNTFIRKIIKR